jgi:hypothetical protein
VLTVPEPQPWKKRWIFLLGEGRTGLEETDRVCCKKHPVEELARGWLALRGTCDVRGIMRCLKRRPSRRGASRVTGPSPAPPRRRRHYAPKSQVQLQAFEASHTSLISAPLKTSHHAHPSANTGWREEKRKSTEDMALGSGC